MVPQRHSQPFALPHPLGLLVVLRLHVTDFGFGDRVNEGDVLTLFQIEVVAFAANGHALAVLAWVVPHEVVHGADVEVLLELLGIRAPDDEVEPISKRNHGYSTPINRASPR